MTDKQKLEFRELLDEELNKAEDIWNEVGDEFKLESLKKSVLLSESKVETQIPGFPFLDEGKPKIGDFVAFVLDVRGSTSHLLNAIKAGASQLERVLYETTAINCLGSFVIKKYNGGITEYLGDGFLALFKAESRRDVYKPQNAAKDCLVGLELVNEILMTRYALPELEIGIGLAYSKAIVTTVGTSENLHPKVMGECVYRASKLATGFNEILYGESLRYFWPSETKGKIRFKEVSHKNATIQKGKKLKAFKIEKT